MGSRSSAILPRLNPKPPPDPSARHQDSAIAPDDVHFPTFRTPDRPLRERRLVCGKLDFNGLNLAHQAVKALTEILADPAAWYRLEVRNQCFFRTGDRRLPTDPGWYLICEGQQTP